MPGGDIQRRAFGKEAVLELRFPVKSKQEADERAAAELAKRANDLVKGEGETFGFPELLPDTNVALAGLGSKFSTTYYVEQDRPSLRRVRLPHAVLDREDRSHELGASPSTSRAGARPAAASRASPPRRCRSNDDPERLGRVKLKLPWRERRLRDRLGAHRRRRWPAAAAARCFLPEVGDEVLVAFDRDDIRYPYVLGALWSKHRQAARSQRATARTTCASSSRARATSCCFDDGERRDASRIELSDGKKIEIDDDGIRITDKANKITLDARTGVDHASRRRQSLTLKAPKITDRGLGLARPQGRRLAERRAPAS